MSEKDPLQSGGEPAAPWLRRLLENPWLLLVLGVAVPTVSYTVWGLVELVLLPSARLP